MKNTMAPIAVSPWGLVTIQLVLQSHCPSWVSPFLGSQAIGSHLSFVYIQKNVISSSLLVPLLYVISLLGARMIEPLSTSLSHLYPSSVIQSGRDPPAPHVLPSICAGHTLTLLLSVTLTQNARQFLVGCLHLYRRTLLRVPRVSFLWTGHARVPGYSSISLSPSDTYEVICPLWAHVIG